MINLKANPAPATERPRTTTSQYHFPPARPDPAAADCTREHLLDIAREACRDSWTLVGSRDHVEAICRDYAERMEPALRDSEAALVRADAAIREMQEALARAQQIAAAAELRVERAVADLDASRNAHQVTANDLETTRQLATDWEAMYRREREAHNETLQQMVRGLRSDLAVPS